MLDGSSAEIPVGHSSQAEQQAVKQAVQGGDQSIAPQTGQPEDSQAIQGSIGQPESAESQNPKQQYIDQLPPYLKERFSIELKNLLSVIREQDTQGLKEVGTLVLLIRMDREGNLPPGLKDPEKNVITIEFEIKPLQIEIDGSTKNIVKIIGVENGNFVCVLLDPEGNESQENIPTYQVIEAQKKIVEEAQETGIIKASALRAFLEKAKDELTSQQAKEEQSSPEDIQQQEDIRQQLDKIENLISQLEGQLIPDQQTFVDALSLVLHSQSSAIQEQIQKIQNSLNDPNLSQEERQNLESTLQQILTISQEQSQELINEWAQKVYGGKLSPKEIDHINNLLKTGDIDSIQELLQDGGNDSEATNKAKRGARAVINAIEAAKKYGPAVGGILGILLLLMIFNAAKSGGGHGQMG